VYVCAPPIVARQRLGKNVTAATNRHATIEELLDASSSMRSMSYQRKVGGLFFPELLVFNKESHYIELVREFHYIMYILIALLLGTHFLTVVRRNVANCVAEI
jgi:hypothetical protein